MDPEEEAQLLAGLRQDYDPAADIASLQREHNTEPVRRALDSNGLDRSWMRPPSPFESTSSEQMDADTEAMAPAPPPRESSDRRRVRRERSHLRSSVPHAITDALVSPFDEDARQRMAQRWDSLTNSPGRVAADTFIGSSEGTTGEYQGAGAGTVGAFDAITLGHGDEIGAAVSGRPIADVRQQARTAREQNPSMHTIGNLSGNLLLGAAIPAPTGGRLARIGGAALQGGGLAALGAHGYSDADTPEQRYQAMRDAAPGGALMGGAMATGAEGLGWMAQRRTPQQLDELAQARDEALLGATTSSDRRSAAIRAFGEGETPAAIDASRSRAAQALRDSGVMTYGNGLPRIQTPHQAGQRFAQGMQQQGEVMDEIATGMGSGGPTGQDVAARLREAARPPEPGTFREPNAPVPGRAPSRVAGAPQRAAMEDFADRYATEYGDRPITFQDRIGELGDLEASGAYRTRAGREIPLREEAQRQVGRAITGAYDEAVEAGLGPDAAGRYQESRRLYGPLREAQRQSQLANSPGMGMMDLMGAGIGGTAGATAMGSAGGFAGGVAVPLAMRGYRSVEPSVRAFGADVLYRVAQAHPEALGPYAQRILEAGRRGGQALAVEHFVLSQRDPAYRQAIESIPADQVPQEEQTP